MNRNMNTIKKLKTINDVYLKIYFEYGFIDEYISEKYFGVNPNKELLKLVNGKMKDCANKFIVAYENKKINSQKNRIKRFYSKINTDNGSITSQSVIKLLKKQNFNCAICGCYLTYDKNKHLDHIIPLSKGGSHILSNVQWTCRHCNLLKHNKIYANHN